MELFGIDHGWGSPSVTALKERGVHFVCGYASDRDVSDGLRTKDLSRAEVNRLSTAGISSVLVWETSESRAKAGHDAGVQDARDAMAEAQVQGKPPRRPIYFAVDFDAAGPEVVPYFR